MTTSCPELSDAFKKTALQRRLSQPHSSQSEEQIVKENQSPINVSDPAGTDKDIDEAKQKSYVLHFAICLQKRQQLSKESR